MPAAGDATFKKGSQHPKETIRLVNILMQSDLEGDQISMSCQGHRGDMSQHIF